ncbi:hypothetical protein Tco_0151488 [Tanacetum coccineum]
MSKHQTEGPPFTDHMKAICNLDEPLDSKAPKPSSQTEEVPQGKNPGAKSGLRRKQSSKHTSESKTEASKSKTSQLEMKTQSILTKDKSLSHPSPPTPVVGEMHRGHHSSNWMGLCTTFLGGPPVKKGPTLSSVVVPNDAVQSYGQCNFIRENKRLRNLSDQLKDTRNYLCIHPGPLHIEM